MLFSPYMLFTTTPQDLLTLIGSVCLIFITIFLCWMLYEIARLVRQGNQMVEETREKVGRVEEAFLHIAEKMGAASQYLGLIATAGRELFSWIRTRDGHADDPESDDEEPSEDHSLPKQKRRR